MTLIPLIIAAIASAHIDAVDTRVGTAHSETKAAGMFGKGTEELGQTLPAVLVPNGMNFWTPQTQASEHKCDAPYYYSDTAIQGFRNSHWIVGGCTQDYGSMTLMPIADTLRCLPEERASRFSHDTETATPSYYSVRLDDYGITAEMTGTSRAAIFRFSYDESGQGHLIVNPNSDESQGYIEIDTIRRQIRGYNPVHRIYQGKGQPAGFSGYFVVQLDRPITGYGVYDADTVIHGTTVIHDRPDAGAFVRFSVDRDCPVTVRAASSFTDMAGAQRNLDTEISHNDFDLVRRNLTDTWNARLGIIDIQEASPADSAKFYGALYRSSFLPRTVNDVDGRYPSFAGGTSIMTVPDGHTYYDDYSMWDTYRALHPLLNIIAPAQSADMMQSLVLKYEQGGWLPIFPCWNSYTAAMIGDHCIAAIADAYVKGIRGFDTATAYEAMRKNAFQSPDSPDEYRDGMGRRALDTYLRYGYIPLEDSVPYAYHRREQVSRTLEYAFDDFALSQVARDLGHDTDYRELTARARNYRNVIDPATGYVQGRHADGTFLSDHGSVTGFAPFITEGAPCHYTWYAPHDVYGLMDAMGGRDAYIARLDSMFSHRRYWHGNEPCHQVAWMYNYAGQPWKTQREVRHIMDTEYLDTPGGLSGNDDAGQMSAWYIFAALGFYPVCPASDEYVVGAPLFEKAVINLENGNKFIIEAPGVSRENYIVESITLNGKPLDGFKISHPDIMAGGTLRFNLKHK